MAYPLSAPVITGQATEADQYNNLRRDALYLGGEAENSGTLFDLLNSGNVRLIRSKTDEITLSAPCALMIDGTICAIRKDISVTVSAAYYPTARHLYVHGKSDGQGGITLSVADAAAERSGTRLLGAFQWSGSALIPDTLRGVNHNIEADGSQCQGRLTLVPGDPLPNIEIQNARTLYFTPWRGNAVDLYLGGVWERFRFSELALELAGLSADTVHDIFLWADGSGLRLLSRPWGTLGPRPAGMLRWQDGIRVSAADPSMRYVGSLALSGNGVTCDGPRDRLLWNGDGIPRLLRASLSPDARGGAVSMGGWNPYFGAEAPTVRALVACEDGSAELYGWGATVAQSDEDAQNGRYAVTGILRGNTPAAVGMKSFGGGASWTRLRDSHTGLNEYRLAVFGNYPFALLGADSASGSIPALEGSVR